jgi:hypothetical protein
MVSDPEPVASMYARELGERIFMVAEGIPLGEMLTCLPIRGAEAVKKTGCRIAQSARWLEMES